MCFIIYWQKDRCFDSFGIEHTPQEVLNKIRDKSITHNMFRIQNNESIMGGFYCIAFIKYMLAGKALLHFTNLFSPVEYCKIIYRYFEHRYVKSRVQIK